MLLSWCLQPGLELNRVQNYIKGIEEQDELSVFWGWFVFPPKVGLT